MINSTQIIHQHQPGIKPRHQAPSKHSFRELLDQEQRQLTISKHANDRLRSRGIQINQLEWNQIQQKLVEANQKGIKDALIVTKQAAIVANTEKQTIITVLNRQEASSHIFNNINGTILMD